MSVRIVIDSASDITQAEAKALNVDVLPLKTIFGQEEYLDGVTMDHTAFYNKLIESDVMPTTSQLSPFDFEEAFRKALEQDDEVLCITVSSKLSGCYQSACIAAEEFPGKVAVVDSLNVAIGERILVQLACKLRDEGKTVTEISESLNERKHHIRLIALLDTLEYLKKGGRISSAAALAGSLLSIKPVIAIEDGLVSILGKARGSKNGNNMLRDLVEKSGGIHFDMPFALAYTGLEDTLLQKYIADSANLYEGQVARLPIYPIGSTIGTHAGPGAIAVAFFSND
jgi:DegV family protein with EDD domain